MSSETKEVVEKILLAINEVGGCDATDEYAKGWDEAIGEALYQIYQVTDININDVLIGNDN